MEIMKELSHFTTQLCGIPVYVTPAY